MEELALQAAALEAPATLNYGDKSECDDKDSISFKLTVRLPTKVR